MFPPRRGDKPPAASPSSTSGPHAQALSGDSLSSSSGRSSRRTCSSTDGGDAAAFAEESCDDDWSWPTAAGPADGDGEAGPGAGGAEENWRRACSRQRLKANATRTLVRTVASWGPQPARLVDLRTGGQLVVTYWLRDDVKALCIFNREDTQVRVCACSHMERCEEAAAAPEVAARRFFLGLRSEELRRAVLVTMERSAQGAQVFQREFASNLRPQLLLLCADSRKQRDLLGALHALMSELMLHDLPATSARSPFYELTGSQRSEEEAECDHPLSSWPSVKPAVATSPESSGPEAVVALPEAAVAPPP